jgi:hypothetical protein
MIESIGFGVVSALLFFALGGIRRLPWRYTALAGLGFGLVCATLRLATVGLDPGLSVLLGALGGSMSAVAIERGDRARDRHTAAILENTTSPAS